MKTITRLLSFALFGILGTLPLQSTANFFERKEVQWPIIGAAVGAALGCMLYLEDLKEWKKKQKKVDTEKPSLLTYIAITSSIGAVYGFAATRLVKQATNNAWSGRFGGWQKSQNGIHELSDNVKELFGPTISNKATSFELLGLDRNELNGKTREEQKQLIDKALRKRSLKIHPDRNNNSTVSVAAFQELGKAKENVYDTYGL